MFFKHRSWFKYSSSRLIRYAASQAFQYSCSISSLLFPISLLGHVTTQLLYSISIYSPPFSLFKCFLPSLTNICLSSSQISSLTTNPSTMDSQLSLTYCLACSYSSGLSSFSLSTISLNLVCCCFRSSVIVCFPHSSTNTPCTSLTIPQTSSHHPLHADQMKLL